MCSASYTHAHPTASIFSSDFLSRLRTYESDESDEEDFRGRSVFIRPQPFFRAETHKKAFFCLAHLPTILEKKVCYALPWYVRKKVFLLVNKRQGQKAGEGRFVGLSSATRNVITAFLTPAGYK